MKGYLLLLGVFNRTMSIYNNGHLLPTNIKNNNIVSQKCLKKMPKLNKYIPKHGSSDCRAGD